MRVSLSMVVLTVVLAGCSSEAPVTVELGQNPFWGSPQLKITSTTDEVVIETVEVNRGNCKVNSHEPLPHTLEFGDSFKVDAPGCQNLLQASVETSGGSYDFSFDN